MLQKNIEKAYSDLTPRFNRWCPFSKFVNPKREQVRMTQYRVLPEPQNTSCHRPQPRWGFIFPTLAKLISTA